MRLLKTPARRFLFFSLSATVLACLTACRGFLELFSVALPYDDTGYMLSLIKGFNEHGHLYQRIFSQYGPFYSEFYYFVCRVLGVPTTHDGIRLIVLVLWIFSSIAGALLAFRLTGRIWIALMAQLLCFHVLDRLAWEPGHPMSLIVACFGGLALCLSGRESEQPRLWRPIAIGVLLAALLMIKINLGLFALAAVGTAWIYCSPLDLPGKVLRWVAAFLFSTPLLLVWTNWPAPVRTYFAILFICSLASVLICFRGTVFDWQTSIRFGLWTLAALLLTGALGLTGVLLTGSAWTDLVDGIITGPSQLGTIFTVLPAVGKLAAINAIIGLLLALTWRFFFRASPIHHGWLTFGLRLFFLMMVIIWLTTSDQYFSVVLPFLWIASLPNNSDTQNSGTPTWQFGQLSIVLIAVGQALGLYPVSGAQATVLFYLGSLCVLIVVASFLFDLEMSAARNRLTSRRGFALAATFAVAMVVIGMSYRVAYVAVQRYRHFSSLDLPGARLLRSDESSVALYRFLTDNLRDCRPSFLTIPGLNSLYSWLESEPPTGFNTGMNFALLSPDQQRAMVDVGRTCQPFAAVLNRQLLGFWTRGRFQPSGPLIDFVTKECRPIGRVKNYELMMLLDSPIPTLTSCVTLDHEWRASAPANQVTAFLPANFGTVSSAVLLHASSSKATRRPIEIAMTADGLQKVQSAPTSGPRRFSFNLQDAETLSSDSLDQTLIQLRDESARVINLPFLRPPDRRRTK